MFRSIGAALKGRGRSATHKKRTFEPGSADDTLAQYDWAWEFNLSVPRDRAMAQKIAKLSEETFPEFQVLKTSRVVERGYARPGLSGSPIVAIFDHFPSADEVWREVEETWGGGTYGVRAKSQPALLLKTHTFDVPSKKPGADTERKKSPAAEAKEALQAQAIEVGFDALERDGFLAKQLGMAYLTKMLNITLPEEQAPPEEPSLPDRLLNEALETNPRFKERVVNRLMTERFGEEEEDPQVLDERLIARIEEVKGIAELAGWTRQNDSGGGVAGLLRELVSSEQAPEMAGLLMQMFNNAAQQLQTAPPAETPTPSSPVAADPGFHQGGTDEEEFKISEVPGAPGGPLI